MSSRRRLVIEATLFVLIVAGCCQLLYASLGFSPMDEGYMLSGSRRLLDGQLPHRDYVSLRPVLTQALHAHFLLWAGDRLMWWSRLAPLVQMALASWIWVGLLDRAFGVFAGRFRRWCLAFLAFMTGLHTFPLMPWNSIDGFFLMTLGIAGCLVLPSRGRWVALVCLGLAPLTRQNFLLALPLLVLALGEGRRVRSWLFAFLPSLLYGLLLLLGGGLPDAIAQNRSHQSYFLPTAFAFFGRSFELTRPGLLVGATAGALLACFRNPSLRRIGVGLLLGGLAYAIFTLPRYYAGTVHSWFLMGAVVGLTPFVFRGERLRLAILALIVAWSVALSAGYPTPSLGCGPLALLLAAAAFTGLMQEEPVRARELTALAAGLLLLAAVCQFHKARTTMVYFDWPAPYLRHDLGGVLRGATGIRTNPNTFAYVAGIDEAVKWAQRARPDSAVGMVPDLSQFWVTFPRPNPLSSDWPIDGELLNDRVRERLRREVLDCRGRVVFVVAKYRGETMSIRPTPFRPGKSVVVDTLLGNYRLIHETPFCWVVE